jgi:hypothetical protein
MAGAADLMERLGFSRPADQDDLADQVPDDARELADDVDDDDQLPPDPKPARKRTKVAFPETQTKVSAAEKRQVKDALGLIIGVPAGLWAMRDPYCGGALKEQTDAIIKAALPMICRHPGALRFFTSANAPWLDLFGLMTALAPVAAAVYGHHVTHTVGQEEEASDADLSAYTAPSWGA